LPKEQDFGEDSFRPKPTDHCVRETQRSPVECPEGSDSVSPRRQRGAWLTLIRDALNCIGWKGPVLGVSPVEPRNPNSRDVHRIRTEAGDRHFRPPRFEFDDISDIKGFCHSPSLHIKSFRPDDLIRIAQASDFRDERDPPLRIGDVVRLNSGGPACLVVDLAGFEIVVSWRDVGATREQIFLRSCVHRTGVID
jgi:hypothetical protein